MRDIRQDLRDRIGELTSEQAKLHARVAEIEGQKKLLQTLLQEEQRRWPSEVPAASAPPSMGQLSDLILDIISDKDPWYGGTIAKAAQQRGFQFGTSKAGRVVHFTLLGMAKKGLVQSTGTGQWKRAKPPTGIRIKDLDELVFANNL